MSPLRYNAIMNKNILLQVDTALTISKCFHMYHFMWSNPAFFFFPPKTQKGFRTRPRSQGKKVMGLGPALKTLASSYSQIPSQQAPCTTEALVVKSHTSINGSSHQGREQSHATEIPALDSSELDQLKNRGSASGNPESSRRPLPQV